MSHFPRSPWGGARLPDSTEPTGADPLAELLEHLRRPALDDEVADEQRWVARITAAVEAAGTADHPRRAPMGSRRLRVSLSAALAGAVLAAMSGLAYAGALPGPAQGVASGVLGTVGVTAPSSHDGAASDVGAGGSAGEDQSGDIGGTEDTRDDAGGSDDTGGTGDTGGAGDEGSEPSGSGDHGKGKQISELAHNTPAPGKGKVIAPVASGGKSHAGNPPGQAKKGEDGEAHKPSHPSHPSHPGHPSHPSHGGGKGHEHGGGNGNGS